VALAARIVAGEYDGEERSIGDSGAGGCVTMKWFVFAGLALVQSMLPAPAAGQPRSAAPAVPRTPWGVPNLEGVWDRGTMTPIERPKEFHGREFMTKEEAAALEAKPSADEVYFAPGRKVVPTLRTSLIVDPPDGRIPPLTPEAEKRAQAHRANGQRPVRQLTGGISADGPEDRGLAERCLVGMNAGPPMVPSAYNNNMQVVQTRDYVVIVTEMIHDARIIPLDGRPHLPSSIRRWQGESRGHWEGDTLVVETTNLTDKTPSFHRSIVSAIGSGENLRLVERFTRVDLDALLYEFTVNDPTTFTRPFTASLPMRRTIEGMFEYACHEGNHTMQHVLSGARAEEKGTEKGAR
jgi:hypothetical protein